MDGRKVSLAINAVVVAVLVVAGGWTMSAAEPDNAAGVITKSFSQTNRSPYNSFMERLRKEWRVDPLIAERHNLKTGWENPACGPGGGVSIGASQADSHIKCVLSCLKDISLDNPNAILLCRRGCL
jgi:hypothetical protein